MLHTNSSERNAQPSGFKAGLLLLSLTCLLLTGWSPVRVEAYTHQFTSSSGATRIKWPTTTITIALSTSLSSPPGNLRPGGDAEGAARRALDRWSQAAGVTFNVVSSGAQSVSAQGAGDGVSLITVAATPENASVFAAGSELTGRARIFFDPATGAVSEADITINPNLQFSTDGSDDTYDLESTFVHEVGHLLGLDHSGLVGATMQPQQVKNGFSDRAAASARTLSHDDRAGVRTLYNLPGFGGAVSGAVTGAGGPVFGAHVWAESLSSGRVLAGTLSRRDGSYAIGDLPPDDYRVVAEYLDGPVSLGNVAGANRYYNGALAQAPFRTAETTASLAPGACCAAANISVGGAAPTINPRVLGADGFLASAPLTLTPGDRVRLYLGGEGVDRIPAADINSLTPFITLDPQSIRPENFGTAYPVVSLEARVADNAHVANYSLRLRTADGGETAYLSGALAVDPYADEVAPQPIYTTNFFVRQQYRDFLTREPEADGFNAWAYTLNNCPDVNDNDRCDRTHVSVGFFRSDEFQFKGFFVHRFYVASFGRRPTYAEMIPDMERVTGQTDQEVVALREAFVADWVARPAFRSVYDDLSNQAYVDRLLQTAGVSLAFPDRRTGVTRDSLVGDLNAGAKTRARVLRDVAESAAVYNKEYNRAFAAMQYFGYLRRDPDAGGYDDWLRELDRDPDNYRVMVRGFIDSTEYRLRFGLQ